MSFAVPVPGALNTITFGIAGLASSATVGRQSNIVNNATTDKAIDSHVVLQTMSGTTPSGSGTIGFYAFGSIDGALFSGNASAGGDAAFTPAILSMLRLLEQWTVPATANLAMISGPHSIQNAFGGTMPRQWGCFLLNTSGAALNATAGNHTLKYSIGNYSG